MINIEEKRYMPHIIVAIIAIFTCMIIYFFTTYYEVRVDNKTIGIVKNKNEVTDILNNMKENIKKDYKKDVTIKEDIKFVRIMSNDDNITPENELKNNLGKLITLKVDAVAININGKDRLYVKDKNIANKILNEIKDTYKVSNNSNLSFLEKISFSNKNINASDVKNNEEAKQFLLTGSEENTKYIVKEGDNSWTIARNNDMRVNDIQNANPNLNVEKLKPGDEINLVSAKSLLTVKSVENIAYEEAIPFNVVYEDTQDLFQGEKKVKIQGIEGKKNIQAEVIKINGQWSSQNVLKEDIVALSQDQVVLNGIKEKPTYIASGVFSNPTRGTLSSRFGQRWGRGHDGIDIAGPLGTPIYSADGGTVEYSGKMNGYGNIIIINHNNGYKTYYGHCSELVSKKGDKIAKGDLIAKMGNTGRSTGSHLHFEVRKKDVPINPLEYVSY